MTQINIGQPIDIDVLRTSHLLVTGVSGSGKSYVCRVLAEELQPHLPVHIVDPEGDYASLREKFPFVVIAKEGGDAIAHPSTARELALRLLEMHASAIFDLYELPVEQQHEWVRNYVDGLMSVPKDKRTPAAIMIDEAHRFCPENGEGDSVAKMPILNLASAGRKRGFLNIFATQRLSRLDMSARSECQNQFIGRTFNLADAQKSAKIVGIAGAKATAEFLAKLRVLPRGHFYAIGVAISPECVEIAVKAARTSHPKPGELHAPVPPPPAAIKKVLASLSAIPAEVEAKAAEERDLRAELHKLNGDLSVSMARIAELESDVDVARREPRGPDAAKLEELRETVRDRMNLISNEFTRRMEALREVAATMDTALTQTVIDAHKDIERTIADLASDVPFGDRFEMMGRAPEPPDPRITTVTFPPKVAASLLATRKAVEGATTVHLATPSNGTAKLGALHQKVAGILAAYHPQVMKRGILAAMVGRSDGGTFGARLSEMRSAGLIEHPGEGLVRATAECVAKFRGTFRPPRSTGEVLELWRPNLGEVHLAVLEYLIQHRGRAVARADAAAAVGRADGGTFGARLSELRSTGLMVDAGSGLIAANKEALFL